MKNLSLLFIAFLLLQFTTLAQEWYEQTTGVTTELLSVSAAHNSDNVVWACGVSGTVIKTTDGGINWLDVSGNGIPTNLTLNSIECRSADLAMVTGANASSAPVFKTTDGGNTWARTFMAVGGYIFDIVFSTSLNWGLHINPIDGNWIIRWSSNNGDDWDGLMTYAQEGSETGWNNAVCVVYPNGWVGTNNSRVYNSPTGFGWLPQPTPGLTNSKAVWFKSYDVGMVGGDGMVFTTDGGSNWTLISVPGTGDILGITSVFNNWWFVRGSSIYRSTDDGSSWSTVYTAPSGTFNHLVSGNTNLWAVRSDGGISSTQMPVGIEDERRNAIPESFSISQNHPNPFNPSTKIIYSVSQSSNVVIKVFDILGNEIETLIDEEKQTGSYELTWYAENLQSGIYFYRLQAGSFVETKKMVLLR